MDCRCCTCGKRVARSAASRQRLWVCRRTACLLTARLARGMSQARAPSLGCKHHVYLNRVCQGFYATSTCCAPDIAQHQLMAGRQAAQRWGMHA